MKGSASVCWTLMAVFALGCAQAQPEDERFRAFAAEMAARHDMAADEIMRLLGRSERRQDIIDAISSPAEALPWHRYRPIFLTDSRIREGVAFWQREASLLQQASEAYGVPPEVITAIIGVETRYGRHTGSHRVIDALRTLAFDYPPRSDFFRSELEEYFLLAREENFDPLGPKGSYAGAMGIPQFISSSYRAYAVDFNDDGRRDLWDQPADAIGSVANYLAEHGWEAGEPVVSPATGEGEAWREHVSAGLSLDSTVGELRKAGITPEAEYPDEAPAKLLALETESGDALWVARRNFRVITRYNHSPLYAMAVHQLAEAIAERRSGA